MTREKREAASQYFLSLRDKIIHSFEELEPSERFHKEPWNYEQEGGGEISLLRGSVFEKAAVNFSAVAGPHFPLDEREGAFYATGISLITHMKNPKAPTVHMNLRFLETKEKSWFGGGYDLTPMGFPFNEDKEHFHGVAKKTLDELDPSYYPLFSKNAEEYFYIPHRKKERGVGGLFFDHFYPSFEEGFKLVTSLGQTFLDAIMPILRRRIGMSYQEEDRELQLEMRSHYVEFNLLYDRGTRFGFLSKGNPKAILSSMPPLVKW
ncbi:oxygen-dependent coproporphyrinogen oxidase [Criblamydia sequanensis]|uniref:coproporphyrinogen oxidase n=1 Tax=Candidatus Criblamydia sequanensis CRIB-18 TaxID=1437425 RepID=A0A090D2I2_9BACT|nr:oxygen-dependent coproporphyrinogen oxidase [Criblamydia sequanensis]CDR34378.1 Coproporphyrinogen III oxidase [Criblamydia sequanensis CRIB-18]